MGSIEAALAAVESLGPERNPYMRKSRVNMVLSLQHSSDYTKAHQPRSTPASKISKLHPQQKLELLRYIERLTERGLSPNRAMIRNFASQIAQREP
jgi:hypothetical protein